MLALYVVRRVLAALGVLLLDIVLVFFLLHLVPGDPAAAMIGGEQGADKVQLERLREAMGLNRPLYVQLYEYLRGAVRGDLGRSLLSNQKITTMMAVRLPVTLTLAATSMLLGLLIAIPSGIISAVKRGSLWDQGFMLVAILGVSIPDYWLGIVLVLLFSVALRIFPVIGFSMESLSSWFLHIALPTIAVGSHSAALIARMTRSSMLEVLRQDYVALTARAKGIRQTSVILKHALPNAAFPIVTVVGMGIAYLLGGVVVVEMVFALPGLGWLLLNGVQTRDYPVIQGVLLFMAAANVGANLLVDLSYVLIDKRVRYN